MFRIIDRIARAIPKNAIAAIILIVAAIWYAFETSSLNSFSEHEAKSWLHVSEWMLLCSAIVLAIGLAGEWPESKEWKEGSLYKAAKWAVIIGVVGELLGDGGVFKAGDRVQTIADTKISMLEEHLLPRTLDADLFEKLMKGAPSAPVTIIYPRDDLECSWLAGAIYSALRNKLHWDPEFPTPVWRSRGLPHMPDDEPILSQWGGSPVGITIAMKSLPPVAELKAEKMPPKQAITGAGRSPYSVLARALRWSVQGNNHADDIVPMVADDVPLGALRVVIGPRPPLLPQQLKALENAQQ